jgi:UDP-N-acetylglucosamine/UDP-N-acetylgalactosamine diphosphorylase
MSDTNIDTRKLAEQRNAIVSQKARRYRTLLPIENPVLTSPLSHPSPLLQGRKVGCVVMAGGQATRLGSSLPKGVIPFSPVAKKPLLQMIAEKARAYAACYGIEPRLAIMTSEATDKASRELFESHHYFGLRHVEFFMQPSLPLLDMEGQLIMRDDGTVMCGPDGNGSVFAQLYLSGIGEQWEKSGIEAISLIMVDNPMLDPFCPALLEPICTGTDLAVATIERVAPEEQVGLFVAENGHICVVEYSEIDQELGKHRDEGGHLLFHWANISFFGCSIAFLRAASALVLPLHVAKKKVEGREIWKAEYFVFDAMAAAQKVKIVPLPREEFFSPIKDRTSFEKAVEQVMEKDRRRFFALTNKETDRSAPFELSPSAFYPTEGFLAWLRGCDLCRGLVEEPPEGTSGVGNMR